MPFRLRLTYNGLCFFVTDHGQAVHVLLPVTVGLTHNHNGMVMPVPRHYGRIYYDKAHLTPGQQQEAGSLKEQLFEAVALDLTSAGTGGVGLLPSEIAGLRLPTGKKIAVMLRHSMSPNNPNDPDPNNPNRPLEPKRVLARVTMRAGSIACMEPGVHCTYGTDPTTFQITNRAVWEIDPVPGTSLTWPLAGLDGGPPLPTRTLYPIPKNGAGGVKDTIDLYVCNLVKDELPGGKPAQPALNIGDPATHYEHFYRFYKQPGPPKVPLFFSLAGGASCSSSAFSPPGVVPFRCLLAGGPSHP